MMRQNNFRSNCLKEPIQAVEDLAKQIREKLDEFHVSNDEALALLDEIARQCLPFLDPTDKFQALANSLTPKVLEELVDQIPAKGLYKTERRRMAFVHLVATRPAFRNQRMAEDLMSSPWWQFWDNRACPH
jgi:hypothetical protein